MKIKSIIRPDALRGISLLVRVALGLTAVCAVASDPGERTVAGRLAAPPDCHWNLSETKGLLMPELPAFPIPPDVKSKGRRAQDEWFQKWKLTEEGQAFLSQPRKKYDLRVAGGGSFSIAKMPQIMKMYNELSDTPGFIMLGFNLDEDRQKARDYIARKKLAWPQVLLGSWNHEVMREFCVVGKAGLFETLEPCLIGARNGVSQARNGVSQ